MNQPMNLQGPDVTLATNAISSLSFNTTLPKTPNTSARGSVAAFSFNKIPINCTRLERNPNRQLLNVVYHV